MFSPGLVGFSLQNPVMSTPRLGASGSPVTVPRRVKKEKTEPHSPPAADEEEVATVTKRTKAAPAHEPHSPSLGPQERYSPSLVGPIASPPALPALPLL
jgi:hypothetical protein